MRIVVDGVPRAPGKTMAQKRDWMKRHADQLRRGVMLEPRGHADLSGALLTEPVTPGADAGLLFMDAEGYASLSGTAVIATVTVALERRLIESADPSMLTFDTPAGSIHAAARLQVAGERRRVDSVTVTNVPSFVAVGGHPLRLGPRELRVDLAFGGLFYAIVDTEAIGIPLEASTLPELRRLAVQIRDAANADTRLVHPFDPRAGGVAGVVFTGPPNDPEAHLRNVTIAGASYVDRSASVTGTCAVMAVLDAMGLLQEDQPFVHESLIGSLHRGRIARRTQVGELTAIVPEVEGSAWITGDHTFHFDDDDPLREGFLL